MSIRFVFIIFHGIQIKIIFLLDFILKSKSGKGVKICATDVNIYSLYFYSITEHFIYISDDQNYIKLIIFVTVWKQMYKCAAYDQCYLLDRE